MNEAEKQRIEDRLCALEKSQQAIYDLLKPISETYTTVTMLGKWSTAILVFISICIGILLGVLRIIKR